MFSERIYAICAMWQMAHDSGRPFMLEEHCSTPEERAEVLRLIEELSPAKSSTQDRPMNREDQLAELLERWEAMTNADPSTTPADLCRDCPDLLDEFRHLLVRVGRLNCALSNDTHAHLPPATERYHFKSFIARGGMGEVYRGEDTLLKRTVAIKVLRLRLGASISRFRSEAELAAGLKHPGIVPIFDFGELSDQRPFFVMELVEGETLEKVLGVSNADSPNLTRWLQYFEQICHAVAYAHSRKPSLLHRDLKPQNVMIGAFGEVLVLDWGIAKLVLESAASDHEQAVNPPFPSASGPQRSTVHGVGSRGSGTPDDETATGVAKGTLAYWAPEQARGEKGIGTPADVFALGGILCRMLTGAPTFRSEGAFPRAVAGDLSETFALLDQCGANQELIALTKRCLEPEAAKRFRDASEVANAVRQYQDSVQERLKQAEVERATAQAEQEKAEAYRQAAEERTRRERQRRRAHLQLVATLFVVLAGLGIAGWWYDHKTSQERQRITRNTEAMETALVRVETALGDDNVDAARVQFEQLEKRIGEGGGEHLLTRLERCRSDFAMLERMNRMNDFRWTSVNGKLPDLQQIAARLSEAFAAYGIVPGASEESDAVERITASLIRDRLLNALDSWMAFEPIPGVAAILTACDPDPYRESVRRAIQARNRDQLLALLARPQANDEPPRFAMVLGLIAHLSFAERERRLLAVLWRNPGSFIVLMELGGLYPMNREEGAAERAGWYRAALAARPTDPTAWRNLGLALQDAKDLDGAIAAFKEAIRFDPMDASLHNILGVSLLEKQDLDGAIAEYKEAIRLDPKDAAAHNNLGVVLREKQDLDGAIAECEEAIRLDAKDAAAHNNLGNARRDTKDFDGAIAAYKEAIRLDPKYAGPHNGLGNALRDKQDLDGAIAAYKEAIRLNPKEAGTHFNLGNALRDKQDLDGAIAAYKEAIRLNPKEAGTHYNLGNALRDKHDLDGAIAAYKEAIRLNPKDAQTHHNLGFELYNKQDLDGAIAEFKEVIRLNPNDAGPHTNLGNVLRAKQDLDGAIAAYKEAIRLNPNDAVPHSNLGLALYQKKDLDGASAAFKEAIRLNPSDSGPHGNLAVVLRIQGRFVKASDELITMRKLLPADSPFHRAVQAELAQTEEMIGIEKKLADFLVHGVKPETPVEYLRFGEMCGKYQKRYTLAVRFYTDGLAAAPKLTLTAAALAGHVYLAACYAALAADGKGIDPPPVADRPELRRQARDWLAGALEIRVKDLDVAPEKSRAAIHADMEQWLSDKDLTSIRDPERIKALDPNEQAAFERLWRDVRAIRDRASLKRELLPAPKEDKQDI